MRQQDMICLVPKCLKQIEQEYGVRVLYAAESGSRAWGTSTEESDYDVRFIYIRPQKEYLRLDQTRDVMEFPIEEGWDMCGWDLSKMLQLLYSSNSQIYEWFGSPIVYVDDGFSQRVRPVLDAYFSTKTTVYHYLHQTLLKLKKIQKNDTPRVKYYLYALQYAGAARWVLEHGKPVPVGMAEMVETLSEEIREISRELLHRKLSRPLEKLMPRHEELDAWLQAEICRMDEIVRQIPKEPEKSWESLNSFFLSELERQ